MEMRSWTYSVRHTLCRRACRILCIAVFAALVFWQQIGAAEVPSSAAEAKKWIGLHLPEMGVDEATVGYCGFEKNYLSFKTGGTIHFRGYYVFRIDLSSLSPDHVEIDSAEGAAILRIKSAGQESLLEEVCYMDGSFDSVPRLLIEIDCRTRPAAIEFKRCLRVLAGKSAADDHVKTD